MTRRFLALSAALVFVVIAIVSAALLPPRATPAVTATFPLTWPVVRGAYHIHSQRSDGTGTVDEIAAAAARAGLQFVILTDHGDGTRAPSPPAYRSGVLCIDGVEISTDDGHYVAVGVPQAPYRLAGHARSVIEDVHRLGGFGFVAHPDSPKRDLTWKDWNAPADGLEWLNADSEWRDEFWTSLTAMLLTYPWRPAETLGALLDRPASVLTQWETLTRERRVVGVAGADAHARLGYRQATDPYQDYVLARVPGYETSFRAFSNHVILASPLTGDAASDTALILTALREGHVFTSIDSLAGLSAFEVKATSANAAATPGAYLDITAPVAIEAAIAAPPGTRLVVFHDGEMLYETSEPALRIDVGRQAGAYRVEAHLPGYDRTRAVPWVLANPIYVGLRDQHAAALASASPGATTTRSAIATESWTAEASDGSSSALRSLTLEDGTPALEWQFTLAGGVRGPQFAAMRFPVHGGLAGQDRLQLRARSDRPMRVWAQVRTAGDAGAERWGTSFYVDDTLRQVDLRFLDFRALGKASATSPPLDRIDSLLLVVDMVNSAPGSAGRLAITDLWLAR